MGMCVVDWSAAGAWAQAAAGLIGAVAVFWAAKKGAETFGNWQKQKQTESQMAVAERLLLIVYRLEDAFPYVRNPVITGWEGGAADTKLREVFEDFDQKSRAEQTRYQIAQVILTRIEDRRDDWDAVVAARAEARVYFGDEMKSVLDSYWRALGRIRVAALSYGLANTQAERGRYEADFYEGAHEIYDTEDIVGNLVSTAKSQAEARLLPLLTSHLRND